MECLFCKMAKGEIDAEIIYEDNHAFGVLDINPTSPGHAMVIPRVHAENILDLPDEEVAPVFQAVKKVTALLREKLNPDAFTLGINHGKKAGQAIDHLHIHIVPRYEGDGGGNIHSVVNNPPNESVAETAKRIRG